MEIEDELVKVIREKLVEVPKENIVVNAKPSKLPAVIISNIEFEFKNSDLSENLDRGNIELEETLDSDGLKTSYKLQEPPLNKTIRVESPPGTLLAEKEYTVNYADGSIKFRKAPEKGKRKIFVKYNSQKRVIALKSLKVKALYSVDVSCGSRIEADSLAEKVVKALLMVENQSLGEGVEIKPLGGITSMEEGGKTAKVQLKYAVETEIQVEQLVGPMGKIEITSKNK